MPSLLEILTDMLGSCGKSRRARLIALIAAGGILTCCQSSRGGGPVQAFRVDVSNPSIYQQHLAQGVAAAAQGEPELEFDLANLMDFDLSRFEPRVAIPILLSLLIVLVVGRTLRHQPQEIEPLSSNPHRKLQLPVPLTRLPETVPEPGLARSCAGKTVVILDDDFETTQMLFLRFQQLGMISWRTPDGVQALLGALTQKPDLMILDVNMPTGNGLAVCEMLKCSDGFAGLPMIVYTGSSSEATIRRCHELGAHYVMKGPNSWSKIEHLVDRIFDGATEPHMLNVPEYPSSQAADKPAIPVSGSQIPAVSHSESDTVELMKNSFPDPVCAAQPKEVVTPIARIDSESAILDTSTPSDASPASPVTSVIDDPGTLEVTEPNNATEKTRQPKLRQRPLVLIIDDDPGISSAIALRLRTYEVDVLPAYTGMAGFWKAVSTHPDLILCDMRMPDGEGNYVVGRLQSHPLTKDIPVIMVSGQESPGLQRIMANMGVKAYFTKPLIMSDLIEELRRHIVLSAAQFRRTTPHPARLATEALLFSR